MKALARRYLLRRKRARLAKLTNGSFAAPIALYMGLL